MEIMVNLRWAGATEVRDHRVAIDSEPGTAGSSVSGAICAFLGTEVLLLIGGADVRATRFAESPLVDGATITLHPCAVDPAASHSSLPTRSTEDRTSSSPRLTVVSGVACGTELVISRGSQWLQTVDGVPVLNVGATTGHASHRSTEIVMDHDDVRIMPGSVPLREGDRLHCGDSWLQMSTPSGGPSDRHRVSWSAAPTDDDSPARVITVHRASGQGARMGLVMGLLPLVLGVVITVVTGMWFFMLFSALGAIVAVVSWGVGRAARTRERAHVRAALARDLTRCGEAAPSAAEVVNRLAALDSGRPLNLTTRAMDPGPCERWVRLGEAERTAAVHLGDGPGALALQHRLAPALVDLSRVDHLEIAAPSRHRGEVVNSLALQLLTGPGALQQLIVDPGLDWRAPQLPALRVVSARQQRSVTGPALEVYSVQTAAVTPTTEDRVRLVVTVTGDSSESHGPGAVLSWDSTATLTCDVVDAVPGLDASAGRDRIELRVDSVTSAVFDLAMQQWSRVQAAIPSLRDISGLPESVGSELVLPEPFRIPQLWSATARLPALEAAIGVSRHGVESLTLGDEQPHLLIAGTTGCGKSEVLRTLVASLACRYSPERLEFLFVDFKGGAALSPLTGLPHRSTLLTDLAPEDVRRALEFLRAELRRRERVLAERGLSDIHGLLGTTPASEPLAFRELVVVVDEVKMLVDAFSTAGEELAKIATVGRSLGIHLVLATQRPQGAIPADVRANVTQALCLRVRTEQDSADVIGASVAARISSTTPGRAFLETGHGAPVEVQTAILTGCAAPPADEVHIRLPGIEPSGRAHRRTDPAGAVEIGARRVVAEIAAAHGCRTVSHAGRSHPASAPAEDESSVRPVPAPLPESVAARPSERGELDLGPAENSAEHWTGRAAWRPLEDGTLFFIGQPMHTSRALLSAVEQLVRARLHPAHGSGRRVALYVIATTPVIENPVRRWADAGLIHGIATSNDPSGLKGLLERLGEGSQRFLSHSGDGVCIPPEPAVLLVEDWDRCCTLLRAGPWAYLEDDLLALASAGSQNGVAMILAGDRSLSVGRASSAGRTRVYFPADQTPEALLQWPTFPAVNPLPLRSVLQGTAASKCSNAPAQRSRGAHTVTQFPEPSGGVALAGRALGRATPSEPVATEQEAGIDDPVGLEIPLVSPDTVIWPRYRPLPERWSAPDVHGPGLLVGLGASHVPLSSTWGPGSTLLVVGPSRSGRSTYLASVKEPFESHPVVHCHPDSVDSVERLFAGAASGATVIIDDADSLGTQVIQRLGALWQPGVGTSGVGARNDLRLIVSLRLNDGLPAIFPPLMQWRHVADALLLRPRRAFDGDLFGATLTGMPMGGPPGRGYWIHRGCAELVQTPQRDG